MISLKKASKRMMQAWIWLGEIYQVEEKEARKMKVIVAEKARTISNDIGK